MFAFDTNSNLLGLMYGFDSGVIFDADPNIGGSVGSPNNINKL